MIFAAGRLVLPSSAFFAFSDAGAIADSIAKGELAGRTISTELGTDAAESSIFTWNAFVQRIVKSYVASIVRNECVGGAWFALKVIRCHIIFVATATAHGTWFCFGNVRTSQWAIFAGNMFGVNSAVVIDVLSTLTEVTGNVVTEVRLVLVVTGGANLTV